MARFRTIFLLAISVGLVALAASLLVARTVSGDREPPTTIVAALIFFSACALTFGLQLLPPTLPQADAHGVTLIRRKRVRLVGITVASAMLAIACAMIASPSEAWIGIAGAGFFGLGAAIGAFRLTQPGALYRLDPVGFSCLGGQTWFVPWRLVRGLDAYGAAGQYWLALSVDQGQPLEPALRAQINRRAGYPAITVSVADSGIPFETFTALVQRYWERGRLMQAHN